MQIDASELTREELLELQVFWSVVPGESGTVENMA